MISAASVVLSSPYLAVTAVAQGVGECHYVIPVTQAVDLQCTASCLPYLERIVPINGVLCTGTRLALYLFA